VSRRPNAPSTAEKRIAAWDAFDRISDRELGDALVDLELTEAVCTEIAREVIAELGLAGMRWYEVPQLLKPELSPHLDAIAVRRALDFEWDVVETLTAQEYSLFIDQLVDMKDPWSQGNKELLDEVLADSRHKIGSKMRRPDPRRLRYLSATPRQHARMERSFERRKKDRRAAGEREAA